MTEWKLSSCTLLLLVAAVHAQDVPPEVAMVDVDGETAVDREQEPPGVMNEREMEPIARNEQEPPGANLQDEEDRQGWLILTSLECFWHSLCCLIKYYLYSLTQGAMPLKYFQDVTINVGSVTFGQAMVIAIIIMRTS